MKKNASFITHLYFFSLIVFCVSLFWDIHSCNAQDFVAYSNNLCDSSFEQSTIFGAFPNSGCYQSAVWGDASAVLDGVATHVRTGGKSLHIYTGNTGTYYVSQPAHIAVPVTSGQSYTARAYFKFPPEANFTWVSGSKVFLRLIFINQSGTEISFFDGPYLDKPTSWTKSEVTAVAPLTSVSAKVVMRLEKPQVSGICVVNADDCSLFQTVLPASIKVQPKIVSYGAFNDSVFLKISNEGGESLSFNFSTPIVSWLNVNPISGVILPGNKKYITVALNRNSIPAIPCNQIYSQLKIISSVSPDTTVIPVSVLTPCGVPAQLSVVSVTGSQLIVQKRLPCSTLSPPKPYMIKGFCWSPASVETIGNYVSRKQAFEKWAAKDLGMIRGCQGNTVYTFLDFGLNQNVYRKILDSLYENGIMAIITVDNDGSYDTVNMRSVVNAYKNHPAVLMWALGNEWNINLYHNHFSSVQQAAISTEIAAQLIKSLDPLHPVASIYGDINITSQYPNTSTIVNTLCPTVDVWGLNIYRGNQFYYLFSEWAAITNKPMFLSEFGIDAFHSTQWNPLPPVGSVNETEQKDWNHSLWMDIQPELSAKNPSRQCLGGTYFEWNDEFWKVNPVAIQNTGGFYTNWNPGAFPDSFANEEFFGIASIDSNIRIPRESYNQIATDFRDTLMAQFTACDTIYGLCDIQGVRFYDLSSGSPKSWLWNFGDGTISTLPNPEHVYQAEGLYSVSLTVYYQNQSSTTAKANYIHAISCQSALSGINISNNQTNCYNATQVITVAGNNTTFSVQNGGSTTMIAGQIINFLPGTHVFQGGYCHGFISTTGPFCPSGGNPPPSNENSFNTSLTSIPGNTSSSFKIFPNPTSGVFTLEFQNEIESGTCYLEVYGITGNLMIERNLSSEKKHELSLSGNPSGLYFIRLITGNKVETRKVVKQ